MNIAEKSNEKFKGNVAGMTQAAEISSAPKRDSSSEDSLDYPAKQMPRLRRQILQVQDRK